MLVAFFLRLVMWFGFQVASKDNVVVYTPSSCGSKPALDFSDGEVSWGFVFVIVFCFLSLDVE